MEYKFRCDVKSSDLWKISMCATYHSFAGVMNLIFTVSALAAAFGLWDERLGGHENARAAASAAFAPASLAQTCFSATSVR